MSDLPRLNKTCQNCKQSKDLSQFYKNVGRKRYQNTLSIVQNTCIACHSVLRKKHYEENKEFYKNKHLMRTYGISVEDYKRLQIAQDNKCACCNNPETRMSRFTKAISDLAVDHCHVSGRVRGLLCFKCNMAIGLLRDNLDILKGAMNYLKK